MPRPMVLLTVSILRPDYEILESENIGVSEGESEFENIRVSEGESEFENIVNDNDNENMNDR